jgi:hypothetical protein
VVDIRVPRKAGNLLTRWGTISSKLALRRSVNLTSLTIYSQVFSVGSSFQLSPVKLCMSLWPCQGLLHVLSIPFDLIAVLTLGDGYWSWIISSCNFFQAPIVSSVPSVEVRTSNLCHPVRKKDLTSHLWLITLDRISRCTHLYDTCHIAAISLAVTVLDPRDSWLSRVRWVFKSSSVSKHWCLSYFAILSSFKVFYKLL